MQNTTQESNEQCSKQSIKDAEYKIQQILDTGKHYFIQTAAISNNLKYIIAGGSDKILKIWNYNNNLTQSLIFHYEARVCTFTDDSQLLYIGIKKIMYQLDVNSKFKKISKYTIPGSNLSNIYCITNTIILTSSFDTLNKIDINKKEQLLKIHIRKEYIHGLDYNKHLDIIATGCDDSIIKLWSGIDESLIIDHCYEPTNRIQQVLFTENDQLISLDQVSNLIVWQINYQAKKLEQLCLVVNSGKNVSLVLRQYIIAIGERFIRIYTIKGEFIREFAHEVDFFWFFKTIQIDSMKAVLIKGNFKLQICYLYL